MFDAACELADTLARTHPAELAALAYALQDFAVRPRVRVRLVLTG
jgi:hypothetical protein